MRKTDPAEQEAWRRYLASHDYFITRHPPLAFALALAFAFIIPGARIYFLAWAGVFAALVVWASWRSRYLRAKGAPLAERCGVYNWHFACFGLLMGTATPGIVGVDGLSLGGLPALASVAVTAMLMPTMIPARRAYALMAAGALALPGLWLFRHGAQGAAMGAMMVLFCYFFVHQHGRLIAEQLEHIRAEMDRRRLLETLRDQTQERTRLIAALAHDLRQPVNAQRLALTAMRRRHPKESRALDLLLGNTETLAAEVDALLDLGRSASGGLVPKPRPLRPADFLKQLLKGYEAESQARRLRLRGAYRGPSELSLDPAFLRRILGNLIENGLRHARTRIDVEISAAGRALRLKVSDDGDGIPRSLRRRIFEPYVSASADDLPHWGLGLYSARELARALGGDLKLLPAAKGTAFEARLRNIKAFSRSPISRPSN